MEKLIDYLMCQDRRLVFPVGGGAKDRYHRQFDVSRLSCEEEIALWRYFLVQEYGYDFAKSTIPYADLAGYFGLKTYVDKYRTRQIRGGQINSSDDLAKVGDPRFFKALASNPYILSIKAFKRLSEKPMAGGCFGPLTTVGSIYGFENVLINCIKDPAFLEEMLGVFTEIITELAFQYEAQGADFFWVAEPLAVLISPAHFNRYSGRYLKQLFSSLSIPGFLHVPGNTSHLIDEFVRTGAQCLSLDSHVNLKDIAYTVPPDVVILGNINSISLLKDQKDDIKQQVEALNEKIRNFPNFIVSSGGGMIEDTPEENLRALFEVTRKYPFWSRGEFKQIKALWTVMAGKDFGDIYCKIAEMKPSSEVLSASCNEAYAYLHKQLDSGNISPDEYTMRIDAIKRIE